MNSAFFTTTVSAVLGVAVLLSGAHAKDIAGAAQADHGPMHKVFSDDGSAIAKVSAELHNHVDKQTSHSIVSANGDNPMQTDMRSLRQQHKKFSIRAQLQRSWIEDYWLIFRATLGV